MPLNPGIPHNPTKTLISWYRSGQLTLEQECAVEFFRRWSAGHYGQLTLSDVREEHSSPATNEDISTAIDLGLIAYNNGEFFIRQMGQDFLNHIR